jgi:hypothetical protein
MVRYAGVDSIDCVSVVTVCCCWFDGSVSGCSVADFGGDCSEDCWFCGFIRVDSRV